MKFLIIMCMLLATNSWASNELDLLTVKEDPAQKEMMQTLKRRKTMLDWHAYTAWASVGLMAATLATAPEGEYDNTHKWMGISAGATYLLSASLAALAPLPKDTKQKDNIMIHKKLAWIHAPAMALTAYAGWLAHKQYKDDEELSGIAKLHKPMAAITAISFGLAAVLSMDWTVNFIPTGNKKKDIACVFTKNF